MTKYKRYTFYTRVCPDCGDTATVQTRPKEGARCVRCAGLASRSKVPDELQVPCPVCSQPRTLSFRGKRQRTNEVLKAMQRPCRGCSDARKRAEARSFDPVAAQRLAAGIRVGHFTRGERVEAVRILRERGFKRTQIAERLGVKPGTVESYYRAISRDEQKGVAA